MLAIAAIAKPFGERRRRYILNLYLAMYVQIMHRSNKMPARGERSQGAP